MNQSLGRGLGSLIPKKIVITDDEESIVVQEGGKILKVDPSLIDINPHQPRQNFNPEALDSLARSIKQHGIIQPLIVTKIGNRYQLIAGERRLRSSKNIGLKKVPVILREEEEQEKLELSLIENIQREDLNPLEAALAYQRLIDEFNITQEEVSKRVGKARSSITNSLRLLTLLPEIREALISKKITEAHAKYLLGLESKAKQLNVLKKILRNNLNVAETSREIKRLGGTKTSKDYTDLAKEEKLSELFSTKVEIKRQRKGGKIIINFYSEEELDNILKKLDKL